MTDLKIEPPTKALPITVGAISDIGQREENQDSMTGFDSPFGLVYLVADGMGGHHGGAEASRMVTEGFNRHLLAVPASSSQRDAVALAVQLTNLEVLEKGRSGDPDFEGMGSTVAIVLVRQSDDRLELTTAHVGDSRIYLQRDSKLTLLTKDHTQVQWLIESHAIDEASARTHPDANVLTRAIGHTDNLQADISDPIRLLEGDGILICSDGLSGFANDDGIGRIVQENPDPIDCAKQLIQLALASGSTDNMTVQFLRIGRTGTGQAPSLESSGKTKPTPAIALSDSQMRKRGRLIFAIVFLAALAAMGWWVHSYLTRKPVVEHAIHQLRQPVRDILTDAKALQVEAQKSKDAAHRNLAIQEKISKDAKNQARAKDPKDLNVRLRALEDKFNAILQKSGELIQRAQEESAELDELQRSSGSTQNATERQTRIEHLKAAIHEAESQLRDQQQAMESDKAELTKLEAQALGVDEGVGPEKRHEHPHDAPASDVAKKR